MRDSAVPFVSVIIPVFNDADRLRLCLEALEKQTYPGDAYEVIAVDNGSKQSIEDLTRSFPHAVAASDTTPGSYAARNKGIALARGEVLAFTDSDCIPARDWLERGVAKLYSDADGGMVAGAVEIFFRDPARPTAVELHQSLTTFQQERYLSDQHYGATANVLTHRRVIEKVGPFDATLKSGGDNEWGNRVFAAGYKQLYANDVRVAHPARQTLSELSRRVRRLAGGQHDWKQKERRSLLKSLFFDPRPPLRLMARTFFGDRPRGVGQKLRFIGVELFVRYVRAMERTRLYFGAASKR